MTFWQARAQSPAGAVYTCGLVADDRPAAELAALLSVPFPVIASLAVTPVLPEGERKATGG
jgi:hypothetical protein